MPDATAKTMLMNYCLAGVSQRISDMIQRTAANMKFTGIKIRAVR
jgi:hypothetical protein